MPRVKMSARPGLVYLWPASRGPAPLRIPLPALIVAEEPSLESRRNVGEQPMAKSPPGGVVVDAGGA
jgi:hypothetical protein